MEKKTKEMMEQFVAENINLVPRNQSKKFNALTIEQKVEKIQSYIDRAKFWEEVAEKNKVINRVKEMFNKRHATVEDAKEVMAFCEEFISNFKQMELDKLDEEIRKLQERRNALES